MHCASSRHTINHLQSSSAFPHSCGFSAVTELCAHRSCAQSASITTSAQPRALVDRSVLLRGRSFMNRTVTTTTVPTVSSVPTSTDETCPSCGRFQQVVAWVHVPPSLARELPRGQYLVRVHKIACYTRERFCCGCDASLRRTNTVFNHVVASFP